MVVCEALFTRETSSARDSIAMASVMVLPGFVRVSDLQPPAGKHLTWHGVCVNHTSGSLGEIVA